VDTGSCTAAEAVNCRAAAPGCSSIGHWARQACPPPAAVGQPAAVACPLGVLQSALLQLWRLRCRLADLPCPTLYLLHRALQLKMPAAAAALLASLEVAAVATQMQLLLARLASTLAPPPLRLQRRGMAWLQTQEAAGLKLSAARLLRPAVQAFALLGW
jgi:hypothetical protein